MEDVDNTSSGATMMKEEASSETVTAADAALKQPQVTPRERPSNPKDEREIIKSFEDESQQLKLEKIYYLLSSRWWKLWKDFASYDSNNSYSSEARASNPPPIDNEPIIESNDPPGQERLKKACMENYDFVIVSEESWVNLQHWYGGGPALPRKVIPTGWNGTTYSVEVRPLALKVFKSSDMENYILASFSKIDTLSHFKDVMCKRFQLDPNNVRLWDYHANNRYKLLEDLNVKMEGAQIIDGQPMLLEEKDENGKFPDPPKKSTSYGYGYGSSYGYSSSYGNNQQPTDPGCTGLSNLGNTCFMNSSIQCLSNTPPLIQYFISGKYSEDINTDNPLGMKGEIANQYGDLIKDLWAGTHSSLAPRDLKHKIERFAPQFAGYQQHDSQELLAFLLDGLHEDLNRVKTKKYVENPEVEGGRSEEEVAKEAWERHKCRNDSIIVDYFQGQLKSTLVCPKCDRVSITFDPFMYLSLPLPMKTTRTVKVTAVYMDPTKKPIRYGFEVPKNGAIKELKKVIFAKTGIKPEGMVIADVYSSRFFKQFADKEPIDAIQDRDDIYAYEIIPVDEEDVKHIPFTMSKEERMSGFSYGSGTKRSLFGLPFILSVRNASTITYSKLYELTYEQVITRFFEDLPRDRVVRTTDEIDRPASDAPTSEATSAMEESDEGGHDSESAFSSHQNQNDSDSDGELRSRPEPQVKKRKATPLFTFKYSDHYGQGDVSLRDDGRPLELEEGQQISILWSDQIVRGHYNEDSVKITNDPSCERGDDEEPSNGVTLDKCLELFTVAEELGPDDSWYCSRCKEHQQATKKFDLWKLPPVLVVHLKRFSYKNRSSFTSREKLETFVDYPIKELNLSNIVKGPTTIPPIYNLYAVSNHYGSLGGGHYVAHARNKNDKKWYKFDDSHVSKVEESNARSSSAYVLFYIRKDIDEQTSSPTPAPSSATQPAAGNGSSKDEEDTDSDRDQAQPMDQDSENSKMEDQDLR